jgi:hypothetical protein
MANVPLYPLAPANVWTYRTKDGTTYTNEVTAFDAASGRFTMTNSTSPRQVTVYVDDQGMHSDAYEEGKFVMVLTANPKPGDTWQIKFHANGFENILEATIKQVGATVTVGDTSYSEVVILECESKMLVNGSWMALNYFTRYHYATGVGLILTTSSHGDHQALIEHVLH